MSPRMKRRSAPKQPVPIKADPLARLGAVGRGILFAHLLLTPLLFTQANVEGFEFVKFLALIATVLALLVVGTLALPYLSWDIVRHELRQPLVLAGLIFVSSAALSTVASTDWHTSFYGHFENYAGFITILAYFVLFVAAKTLIRTREQIRLMLWAVAFAAIGVTAYGLLQVARFDPLVWENHSIVSGFVRPFSTLGHANYLGAWLILALPLILVLATGRLRIVIGVLAVLMGLLLVLTMSRAAWLGAAGAAVVGLVYWSRSGSGWRRRLLAASAIGMAGLLVVVFLAGESLRSALASRTERFLDGAGRAEIWSASGKMFAERPIVGTGPETFHHHFGRHSGVSFWEHSWGFTPTRAHNEFLHILATQGIVGILAMMGVLGTLVWSLQRAWRLKPDQRGLIVAVAAALGGFFITELFGFTVIACGSLSLVLAAMIARLAQEPLVETAVHVAPPSVLSWRFAQVALIASCGFLFVQLVADPLRADLRSASAQLASTKDGALRRHQEAVRLCPRSPLYWNRYAACAEEAGRWEGDVRERERYYLLARKGYAQAVAREPGNGFHHAGLGRAYTELARLGYANPHEAFAAFDAALARDPSVAYFYVDASQAALQLGDAERAATYVRAGLDRFPDYGVMRRQAALLLLLRNRPLEALPEFDRALAADWKGETGDRELTAKIRGEVIRRMGQSQ